MQKEKLHNLYLLLAIILKYFSFFIYCQAPIATLNTYLLQIHSTVIGLNF